jgi:heterodisulfide reductase subunit B
MQGFGKASGESVEAVFRLLNLPLEELPDWNCCGATTYMSIDEGSAFILAARNLSLAGQAGSRDLVAPCAACYLVLRKLQEYMRQYPAIQQRVDDSLQRAGLPPVGPVHVRHPLEVLYHDVGSKKIGAGVVRHWSGGAVACYYGCQAVRPYAEADSPYNPMRMDELLQAAGVPVVDFPLKTKCCGGSLTGTIHSVGVRLNYILLKEAARKGAQAIATICPLCQFNLDTYQAEMRRETRESLDMPVLYFTQLLGWALGGDFHELGLHRAISGRKLIHQWFSVPKEVQAYV